MKRKLPDLPKSFGAIFSILALLLVALLNGWAYLDRIKNNTISAFVTDQGAVYAAVPFALGVVAGHWASRDQQLPEAAWGFVGTALLVVGMVLADRYTQGALARYPFWIWLIAGIPPGAVAWSMQKVAT